MAKKSQKFRIFSDEKSAEIVIKYIDRHGSYASIANEYGISPKTVETMVRKYRKTGTTFKSKRIGRPKVSDIDYEERYEVLKKYQSFLKAQRERKWIVNPF